MSGHSFLIVGCRRVACLERAHSELYRTWGPAAEGPGVYWVYGSWVGAIPSVWTLGLVCCVRSVCGCSFWAWCNIYISSASGLSSQVVRPAWRKVCLVRPDLHRPFCKRISVPKAPRSGCLGATMGSPPAARVVCAPRAAKICGL